MKFLKSLFNGCTYKKKKENKTCKTSEQREKLPDDIKQRTISKKASNARSKLTVCSKSDHQLVKEAEMKYFQTNTNEDKSTTKGSQDESMKTFDTFEHWNYLPNELKQRIISKMDYLTRYKLSLCSKSDYQNVNKTKMNIYSIKIEERRGVLTTFSSEEFFNCVTVYIGFNGKLTDSVILMFAEKVGVEGKCYLFSQRKVTNAQDSKVDWIKKTIVYERENVWMVAFQFIGEILQKSDFKLKSLDIEMNSPILQSMFYNSLQYITEFFIISEDYEYVLWWLRNVGTLNHITVLYYNVNEKHDITELFERIQKYKNNSIKFYANSLFTEKQFLSLNLTKIVVGIDHLSILTTQSIKKYIKKWKSGKLRSGFYHLFTQFENGFDKEEILEGLEAKEWDDAFREEWKSFCGSFIRKNIPIGKTFYEVFNDKKDRAATLQIDDRFISFDITGRLRKGRMFRSLKR